MGDLVCLRIFFPKTSGDKFFSLTYKKNITLFNTCINFTNVHLCNYCTKIFVIVVNTCVCRRSVDNKM